jgi:hypothetical protein
MLPSVIGGPVSDHLGHGIIDSGGRSGARIAQARNRRVAMTKELDELVEKAKKINMTPEQATEQRRSFVYGNTHIENESITREMVAEADAKVSREEDRNANKTPR